MSNEILYKVLWVEDEYEKFGPVISDAEDFGIELVPVSNWQDAEVELNRDFDSFSAIILDAMCKLKPDDSPEEIFTFKAVTALSAIFERKHPIPWYILSAGTMANFNNVVLYVHSNQNMRLEEWGPEMVFMKDLPDDNPQSSDSLFRQIQKVAAQQHINFVISRHRGVFAYLGTDKLIGGEARSIMAQMLGAFYFPQDYHDFKYDGNPLRKVVEYMFRSAYKHGLLPKDCFERCDQINLLDSCRYMSGLTTKHSNCHFGDPGSLKDGRGGDTIFPEHIANSLRYIISFSNTSSHTNEENPYTIDDEDIVLSENEKELFFGHVMHLCHIIKFYGNYVEAHPDAEANKRMMKIVVANDDSTAEGKTSIDQITGMEGVIEQDNRGLHIGEVRILKDRFSEHIGKRAKIEKVSENSNKNDVDCPYWGTRIKIID